jgi:hypothetical protein
MGPKLALNLLYNVCIFICLAVAYMGITGKRYDFVLAAVFGGAIFITLKIRLLKGVRKTLKP